MIALYRHNRTTDEPTKGFIGNFDSPQKAVAILEREVDDEVGGFYLLDRGDVMGVPSMWKPGERAAVAWYGWEGYQPSEWYTYEIVPES